MKIVFITGLVFLFFLVSKPTGAQVIRKKNVPYQTASTRGHDAKRNILDVYHLDDSAKKKPVLIFIHGGSWGSGNKNTYRLMGKNLAKRGFVAVIINYRLAPEIQYQPMTLDCTKAITWVFKNVERYGGNPEAITLAGHSAGAHLAAFVTIKNTFEKVKISNPVKRLILIDPFGLDLVSYFRQNDNRYSRSLFKVFTANPEHWKNASPLYDISRDFSLPTRILTGAKTYRIIREQGKLFYDSLQTHGTPSEYVVLPGKKHIGMITQFFRPRATAFHWLTNEILAAPMDTK